MSADAPWPYVIFTVVGLAVVTIVGLLLVG